MEGPWGKKDIAFDNLTAAAAAAGFSSVGSKKKLAQIQRLYSPHLE